MIQRSIHFFCLGRVGRVQTFIEALGLKFNVSESDREIGLRLDPIWNLQNSRYYSKHRRRYREDSPQNTSASRLPQRQTGNGGSRRGDGDQYRRDGVKSTPKVEQL